MDSSESDNKAPGFFQKLRKISPKILKGKAHLRDLIMDGMIIFNGFKELGCESMD